MTLQNMVEAAYELIVQEEAAPLSKSSAPRTPKKISKPKSKKVNDQANKTNAGLIRLYTNRSRGEYAIADYDPVKRTITVVEGTCSGGGYSVGPGGSFPWAAAFEPWEAPTPIRVPYNGSVYAPAEPPSALFERFVEDQEPSPGYGPTPSEKETFDDLFFGLTAGVWREA